jgi:carboxyl-terminal processing protease
MEGTVGYLRVASFTEQVAPGIERAFEALRTESGGKMTGLILDLRNNPGGLLDESVALSDDFLNDGTVVEVRGKDAGTSRSYRASRGDLANGLPMLVLINGGSASASEIVAAALQELGRARVMGVRSYGKGSVQTIEPLRSEGALRLTTQRYYTPLGHSIQSQGVIPDIQVTPAEPTDLRRESDLPGALPSDHHIDNRKRVEVAEKDCPERPDGDLMLGCALLFMRTGQEQAFLSALKHTP